MLGCKVAIIGQGHLRRFPAQRIHVAGDILACGAPSRSRWSRWDTEALPTAKGCGSSEVSRNARSPRNGRLAPSAMSIPGLFEFTLSISLFQGSPAEFP